VQVKQQVGPEVIVAVNEHEIEIYIW
jgi:hypothetical protein